MPTRFWTSHRNSASDPSSTCRFWGFTRKYCLLPATKSKATQAQKKKWNERENGKFKLELIKHNYWRWEVMMIIFFVSHSYRVSLIIILHRNKQSRWRSSRRYGMQDVRIMEALGTASNTSERFFSLFCIRIILGCCVKKYNLACVILVGYDADAQGVHRRWWGEKWINRLMCGDDKGWEIFFCVRFLMVGIIFKFFYLIKKLNKKHFWNFTKNLWKKFK